MQIIKPSQIPQFNNYEDINLLLELDLNIENLIQIPKLILYYNNLGYNKIILNYDFNNIRITYFKVCEILISPILKIVKKNNSIIYFKGFPKCIYEKNILRPGLRFYYDKNIDYFESSTKNYYLKENCKYCKYYKDCKVINPEYIKLNSDVEFSPIYSNDYLYEKNFKKISEFQNNELKKYSISLLEDFKSETVHLRKKFIFVDSFPKNLEDSSNERFVYFIYNKVEDFNKTYELILNNFKDFLINELFDLLKIANEFALSFGLMGDGKIRKTFYFNIEDLNEKQLFQLSNIIKIEIDRNQNYWGIGLDFKNEKLVSKKVYYKEKEVFKNDLINFCSDFEDKFKSKLLKLINVFNFPLNQILYDYKYIDNKLVSKKLEFSMQYNNLNIDLLSKVLNIDIKYFQNKDFYTISFELYYDKEEKVNFYYALK